MNIYGVDNWNEYKITKNHLRTQAVSNIKPNLA